MTALGTPADILEDACAYLIIIFLGIIGSGYYNIISGILRGLGDSIMPLIFLLVACTLNTVLDVWFVAGLHWGVAGAAIATIIAQAVSGGLCLLQLCRMKDTFQLSFKSLWPRAQYVGQLIRLGLPSGLTQAIFSFAMIIVQSLTNSFGTAVIAANTVVMRVDGFAMMPNFTFGTAMTTYTGQNIGAGKLDRCVKGTRKGLLLALSVSVALVLLILLFGRYLMQMFTQTQEVISIGMQMLQTLAVGYVAMSVTQVLSGVMRGAGDTMTPMWISIITTVIVRVPVAYGLEFLTRPEGGAMGSGAPHPPVPVPAHLLGHRRHPHLGGLPHGPLEEKIHRGRLHPDGRQGRPPPARPARSLTACSLHSEGRRIPGYASLFCGFPLSLGPGGGQRPGPHLGDRPLAVLQLRGHDTAAPQPARVLPVGVPGVPRQPLHGVLRVFGPVVKAHAKLDGVLVLVVDGGLGRRRLQRGDAHAVQLLLEHRLPQGRHVRLRGFLRGAGGVAAVSGWDTAEDSAVSPSS